MSPSEQSPTYTENWGTPENTFSKEKHQIHSLLNSGYPIRACYRSIKRAKEREIWFSYFLLHLTHTNDTLTTVINETKLIHGVSS